MSSRFWWQMERPPTQCSRKAHESSAWRSTLQQLPRIAIICSFGSTATERARTYATRCANSQYSGTHSNHSQHIDQQREGGYEYDGLTESAIQFLRHENDQRNCISNVLTQAAAELWLDTVMYICDFLMYICGGSGDQSL